MAQDEARSGGSHTGDVVEFLQSVNDIIVFHQIPAELHYAYLRNHLRGRARDWYDVIRADFKRGEAIDFENIQAALKDAFPVVQLEAEFYSAKQQN
ncbi:hypothetical protein NPIL_443751 [Nephila pilipes]|uniref:Retrotransposon gag domain-containing protein n=1 Tax=Nephila pilipes TaxID=299642 RepID=A0A8X6ML90_NEPPI|nr:hypothetical protein NPIL_79511 [Nephila pilipes]GFS76772.1 hypothetical protein NPIL_443751 [Nephila pilipes]